MKLTFSLEFECTEAESDELVQALTDHCSVIGMPNGDTLYLQGLDVKAVAAKANQAVDDLVSRFLMWRLPEDFAPDCGISFSKLHPNGATRYEPVGTNLLTAIQAREMLEHILAAPVTPNVELSGHQRPARKDKDGTD